MLLLARLLACATDYEVERHAGGSAASPRIRLDPADALEIGPVEAGATGSGTFAIHNDGDVLLEVSDLRLDGAADFRLTTSAPLRIPPGEAATVTVELTPTDNQAWTDAIVESNDPSSPSAVLPIYGEGLFPAVGITPAPLDFGGVMVGCAVTRSLDVVSIGEAPVTLEDVLVVGDGFTLAEPLELPVTLEPGDRLPVQLTFTASEILEATGLLYVTSDEPGQVRQAALTASAGLGPAEQSDSWRQPDGPWAATDILIYVDQSGSMSDDQARLRSNFSTLTANLEASLSDYQVAVATRDDGCHNGEIVTSETRDADAVFGDAVGGPAGAWTEAGFTIAWNALQEVGPGGCNEGLLREGAKTLLVMLSDEPEQSPDPWSDYLARFLGLAPTTSVHAVVGDVPGGCASASPGLGYWESAMASGGVTFSICESDWTDFVLDLVASASEAPTDTFPLSWPPDLSSLTVSIDEATATGWSYDADQNALVFAADELPPPGAWVTASYDLAPSCE